MDFNVSFHGKQEQITQNKKQSQPDSYQVKTDLNTSAADEFVKAKRSNGLIEKFYDFLKNTTGAGLGSKKLEKNFQAQMVIMYQKKKQKRI